MRCFLMRLNNTTPSTLLTHIQRAVRVLLCGLIAVLVLVGCTAEATPLPIPTVTLVPATETPTPSPVPPTAIPDQTEEPLVTIELEPTLTATSSAEETAVDPLADELVFIAQRLVAEATGLPTRRIQVVEVQAYTWRDSSLGCPLPDQFVTQVETPGYRIVLMAGEDEYLFHTDIDRVLRCDPANEILPDTLDATEEATEES